MGDLPGVEWDELLLRAIHVDRRQEGGGCFEEVRKASARKRRRGPRGEQDIGEGERGLEAQAREGGRQLGASGDVPDAREKHVWDGVSRTAPRSPHLHLTAFISSQRAE